MCRVSDKIKFCSCAVSSPSMLRNYWILHRFNKDKNLMCMGEAVLPDYLLEPDYELNNITLAKRLNENDAFDEPFAFKSKDRIEIGITHDQQIITYCFRFAKDKWIETEYDTFGLMSNFDEIKFGKFKNLKQ